MKVNFGMAPKYHNKPTTRVVAGEEVTFPSQREADAYAKLAILERAGKIANLARQVKFELKVEGKLVCRYIADFVFEEAGKRVVADAKGFHTPVYKLKKKLMLACLGIEIREL